ncbi:class I SAM-dependent DNA methyltransferase [Bacteroides xylanisolvens]|jgi:type I restriction enzyme M protein|uniref:HsdM family class I SAM-dependent methyltransferase n=1 Tax=Bacteroides TaxID=816 RepID=UPI001C0210A8|nr:MULTISPECIES: class I SAM-dependent DNA methyltransferase [Bacteroides]MBT9888705.1 N-6 DNA methylase [Bacteroides xylanisolvens]MCS2935088.1 type I restriction-modification system subunit M [Bacteroides faecis]UVS50521.1 type I restriction-modification system subunit M [Bacteroides faecis]
MKNIEEIKNQTYALIDDLKKTTTENGLAGSGNEYVVIVEIFLYKFLNDKFIYEAKKENPELANAEDFFAALDAMSEDDYEEMCDSMLDTIILKKEHLIPFLAKRQNEDKFAELFDSTLESIASENSDIFYILNEDETRVSIMKPISDVVSGGTNKKNAFCRSLIGDVASFSFENAFEAGYDFFSTIFEYLIKDYNANGGGNYAEYYTPHAIAAIMAQLLVDPSEDVRSVTCYDPSAGTGTLVIALAHAIGEQNCTVYTQDISDKSSTMMMLNLILNSMSHSLTHVIQGNTLKHPFHKNEDGSLRKFDYIVSNPPFKLDFSDYHSDLKTDSYKGRFFAGIPNIPSKNKKGMEIYLCFFQHLLYSLKEDGKAAIVVPTGFITAKSGIAFKIRKHLVDGEKSILRGVVSMPSNIFANTGTNVSVVFIDKSGVDKPVLIDASKLGETIKENGNQKTKLRTEEIQQIVNTFRNKDVVEDFSVTPTFDEIKEKGYSFSAGQYFDIKIDYVDITEDEFNRRMDNFKTTLRQQFRESHRLEEEILKQLECIGFNENVGKENSNE